VTSNAEPTSWDALAAGLTAALPTLEERAFLLVSWSALPPVYVQFAQEAAGLRVQSGGDDVLPAQRRLGPAGAEQLRAAGWSPPEDDPTGQRTWHLRLPWPARTEEYARLAESCVVLFRDVHGVPVPAELEYRAWREAEPPPEGVTFYEEDLEPYEPHLVLPDLPLRDVQSA
jgi:hypothetical protein